jgi:hypothetical protein
MSPYRENRAIRAFLANAIPPSSDASHEPIADTIVSRSETSIVLSTNAST